MKPLSLSITGLHSFREQQVIDFVALTDTGMFGIFGPTGSGKSTILDALTLALYGDVGRADHNTQAILNHAEKRLQVCLEFEIGGANDRKRYRVERVYKRAEGFSVLHQSSRLLELEPPVEGEHEGVGGKGEASEFGQVVIADSKNAVNQSVRDILGLDQSDFTRAVVLPQGRFAEFLQLTGSERNRMTERLFGLERFGQVLTDKVKDRLDGVQREQATLLAGQQELGDASQTALIAAELTRDEATAALQQATLDLMQAQENQAQAKRVWELQEQATVAQAALESHAKQAATVADVRKTLALAERALRVWPKVQAAQNAQVDLEQWRHTEEDAVAVEANLSAALVGAQTQWQDLQARQTAEEPVLLQRQGQLQDGLVQEEELRLRQREQLEAEVAHQQALANQTEAQTRLTVAQQALMKLHAGIKQAQQELDSHSVAPKRRQRLLALQEAATQWQRQLETERQARANLVGRQEMLKQAQIALAQRVQLRDDLIARLGQARGQLDELGALPPGPNVELATWDAWLAELRPLVQAFKQAEQAAQQAQRVAQGLTTATEQQGILAQQARGKANQAQSVLANLREQREQQIHQDELGMAQRLAGHLQPGCPCPVCGSVAHPHPALRQQPDLDETETGRTWEQWGADIAVAEGAWQAAEQGARQAEGELTRYEATLLAAGREAQQRDKEASAARSSLTTAWQRGIATGLFEFLQATGLSSSAAKRDVG
ncbi:SMC family ATPase, partial [Alicyclobacillaceae bacterium I2511]